MARSIVIVQLPATAPSDVTHRALIYIEDVYRELTEKDLEEGGAVCKLRLD